jgi:hypothetical protein
MKVSGQLHAPDRVPCTYWIGNWVDLRSGLDAVVKRKIPFLYRESNPG